MSYLHDVTPLIVEHNNRNRKKEILHIKHLLNKEAVELIAKIEVANFSVSRLLFSSDVIEAYTLPITRECVEELVLGHDHVFAYLFNDVIRQHVIGAKGDILISFAPLRERARLNDTTIVKDNGGILGILRISRGAVPIRKASSRSAIDFVISALFDKVQR